MKKIAAMFLGLSMLVGTASLFADDAAKDTTKTKKTRAKKTGAALLLAGTLLIYSQTFAFAWDEGFHLLAAQLVAGGKRPYLDFFFPQVPLNTLWNAAWMRVLGQSWRVPHALAALEVFGAVVLACDYVYRRL